MAISNSYDFELVRNEIVTRSFKKMGRLPKGQPLAPEDLTEGVTQLNTMIKSWAAEDIYLWKYETIFLFPQYNQHKYILSPTGDNATLSYNATTLSSSATSGSSSISVTDTTGFVVGYNIGIKLDNNYLFWTTITNIVGTTITLNNALTDNAASGGVVYVYESKVQKPLKCKYATVKTFNQSDDIELNITARKDYRTLANKTQLTDVPTEIMFEPRRKESFVWLNGASSDVTKVIALDVVYPFADFDSLSDEADFPNEWFDTIIYNLAKKLLPDYGVDGSRAQQITDEADRLYAKLLDYDMEDTYLQVDVAIKPPFRRWGR